jgi:hypothetical protein
VCRDVHHARRRRRPSSIIIVILARCRARMSRQEQLPLLLLQLLQKSLLCRARHGC